MSVIIPATISTINYGNKFLESTKNLFGSGDESQEQFRERVFGSINDIFYRYTSKFKDNPNRDENLIDYWFVKETGKYLNSTEALKYLRARSGDKFNLTQVVSDLSPDQFRGVVWVGGEPYDANRFSVDARGGTANGLRNSMVYEPKQDTHVKSGTSTGTNVPGVTATSTYGPLQKPDKQEKTFLWVAGAIVGFIILLPKFR